MNISNFFYFFALIILIFMCALCFRKRRKNQGVIFTTVQAVPVPNQTITIAPGTTAYVAQQSTYPTQAPPLVATAYPVAQAPNVPMPMPQPYPGMAPAPMQMPQPYGQVPNQFASPPSYDQVVKEPYQQQTPYNPHYSGN